MPNGDSYYCEKRGEKKGFINYLKWVNQDIYKRDVVNLKRDGMGKMKWNDGKTYNG